MKRPKRSSRPIKFACDIDPETIQVSLAAPYPGTELYRQAQEQGWLQIQDRELVDTHGIQTAAMNYPKLSSTVIFNSVEDLYRKFYFRPRKMFSLFGGMLRDPEVMKRRLARGRRVLQVPARAQADSAGNGRAGRFRRRLSAW